MTYSVKTRKNYHAHRSQRNQNIHAATGYGTQVKELTKALAFLVLAWALYWLLASLPYVFGN